MFLSPNLVYIAHMTLPIGAPLRGMYDKYPTKKLGAECLYLPRYSQYKQGLNHQVLPNFPASLGGQDQEGYNLNWVNVLHMFHKKTC